MNSPSNKKTDLSTISPKSPTSQRPAANIQEVSVAKIDFSYNRSNISPLGQQRQQKRLKTQIKAPSTNNRELFPKEDNRRQKKAYLKTTNDQDGANRYDGLTRGEQNIYNSFEHRFTQQDHQNTGSLAELLEFRNDFENQSSNVPQTPNQNNPNNESALEESRVEIDEDKELQKSKMSQQRSKKSFSEYDQNQRQSEKKSVSSRMKKQSSVSVSELGTFLTEKNFQKKQKPRIRCYSQEQKEKIIGERKYMPKTQEQLRMQSRYIKGHLGKLNQYRDKQELIKMLKQYDQNKKAIISQSMRKLETSKFLCSVNKLKGLPNTTQIQRSLSLPRFKRPVAQFTLPDPENLTNTQLNKISQKSQNLQLSMSSSKYLYNLKKEQILKKQEKVQSLKEQEFETIETIEKLLRNKGIPFDATVIRKGLMHPQTTKKHDKQFGVVQMPKSLVSNPKYQKFPL